MILVVLQKAVDLEIKRAHSETCHVTFILYIFQSKTSNSLKHFDSTPNTYVVRPPHKRVSDTKDIQKVPVAKQEIRGTDKPQTKTRT